MRKRIHLTESQLYDTVHAMVNEALVEEGVLGNFFGGVASDVKGRWNDARDTQKRQEQQKKIEQVCEIMDELWAGGAFDGMEKKDKDRVIAACDTFDDLAERGWNKEG